MKNKCTIWISRLLLMGLFYFDPFSFQVIQAQNSKDNGTNLVEMVFVKGGTFIMGDSSSYFIYNREKPHYVILTSFYIGKCEITVGQFEEFINETGFQTYADKHGGSWVIYGDEPELKGGVNWRCDVRGNPRSQNDYNHPVIHISWKDAVAYCEWLSRKTGKNYRLPTEAEWEYAAKGGISSKGYPYVSGGIYPLEVGWWGNNSGNETHPVGQKRPNELGIYDMSGNVEEWCNDWYDENYYNRSPSSDPKGPVNGKERVVRGGFWGGDLVIIKDRCSRPPSDRFGGLGFRVASNDPLIGYSNQSENKSTLNQIPLTIENCSCSQQYKPEKKCENAVDGNVETEWIAGGFAPQWIKLTLEGSRNIYKISWVNNMSPEGQVNMDFNFYNEDGNLISTKSDSFYAKNGQTNSATFTDLKNIRQIKITVTKSPSWVSFKEIYVF
ncbi:MAG: formylglycine-generating enzyme family protein [Bacteroidota bacterium]